MYLKKKMMIICFVWRDWMVVVVGYQLVGDMVDSLRLMREATNSCGAAPGI